MPKVNLAGLPPRRRREETRTFVDPAYPETPITLHVRELSPLDQTRVRERAQELVRMHVTGSEEEPACPFPSLDGTAVQLTELACSALATLEMLQCGPPEERYSVIELVLLAERMYTVWDEIMLFIQPYLPGGERRKNSSPEGAAPSSEPLSPLAATPS